MLKFSKGRESHLEIYTRVKSFLKDLLLSRRLKPLPLNISLHENWKDLLKHAISLDLSFDLSYLLI